MTQYVTCRVGGEHFAIPLPRVREIINVCPITPAPQAPRFIRGLINLRGLIVTIVDLAAFLNVSARAVLDGNFLIILRAGRVENRSGDGGGREDESLGLLVDSIGDVLEAENDSIDPVPANVDASLTQGVRGVIRNEDALYSVLDVEVLMSAEVEVG